MKRVIGSLVVVGTVVACSGGGGGGGGASKALSGTIQSSKAYCNGKSCITGASASSFSMSDEDVALAAYNDLNATVIPAMNKVVARIEAGIAEAGVNSCDFIGDDDGMISNGMNADLPLEGVTESGATTYKVETSSVSIPAIFQNPITVSGAAQFTSFTKKISAKDSTGAFMTLHLVCNDVDQWDGSSPDTRPLIAKVFMIDRTTGNKINAYYMKGIENNRLMLVGTIGGKKYKVFFTTAAYGTSPKGSSFDISYANETDYLEASGILYSSSMSSTEIIGSVNGASASCFTSSCNNVNVHGVTTSAFADLLTGGTDFTTATFDETKLQAPTY